MSVSAAGMCPTPKNDVAILSGDLGFQFMFNRHKYTLYFQPFVNYKHFSTGRNGEMSVLAAKGCPSPEMISPFDSSTPSENFMFLTFHKLFDD